MCRLNRAKKNKDEKKRKESQEYLLSAAERDNLDCHCNPAQVVDFLSLVVAEKD